MATRCDCCGNLTDGLFPVFEVKEHNFSTLACIKAFNWCGVCWDRDDCKSPCCGACYWHESVEEQWWWRCFICQGLLDPGYEEPEPEVGAVICDSCAEENGDEEVE